MASHTLTAQPRTAIGKMVDRLRRGYSLPAVVYGHNVPSRPVTVEANSFEAILKQAGTTSLIALRVGQERPVTVLIHDVQRHPTTSRPIHADFYQVKMTEKLEADIELRLVGESPAVKEQGGVLVRTLDTVKVTCLPADLVVAIDVDISALKTFDDRIHVRDLVVPSGLTVMTKSDEVVASVAPPRSEEEIASLSATVEEKVEDVEVAKKVTAEDEEAGEEAADKTTDTASDRPAGEKK